MWPKCYAIYPMENYAWGLGIAVFMHVFMTVLVPSAVGRWCDAERSTLSAWLSEHGLRGPPATIFGFSTVLPASSPLLAIRFYYRMVFIATSSPLLANP